MTSTQPVYAGAAEDLEDPIVGALSAGKAVLLYDGVCGLCNRFVQFVLARDRNDRFRFAALQSVAAANLLRRHGRSTSVLNTLVLVTPGEDGSEILTVKSRASLAILRRLSRPWSMVALLGVLPDALLNWGYDRVANRRYRIWGRYDACPLPSDATRGKFIDF